MSIEILKGTTEFPLQVIGEHAGICWNSPIDDKERNIKRAKGCISSDHGRVMEYVTIDLAISGYSARVIREWYTHIAGGPTRLQQSTRYCDCENFDYVKPPKITSSPDALAVYDGIMKDISTAYGKLLGLGVTKEDAANILPLGMNTVIVDHRNLRNFVSMCHQRLCTRAYWEYRKLMKEIIATLSNVSDEWKWICDNLCVPKCEVLGFCPEALGCGRKPKKEK